MKVAIVTGASSGFGHYIVETLLKKNIHTVATMRNAHRRTELFDLQTKYPQLLTIQNLDVTNSNEREALVKLIQNKFNHQVHFLFNNAGFGLYGALEDQNEEQIRYQMEVNFFAPTLLIQSLLPFLRKSAGKIVNISSIMSEFSMPGGSLYSASKFALEGLSEGLRYELKNKGVQVISLKPGGHRTNFVSAIKWGDNSMAPNSPYYELTQSMKRMMDKLTSRKNAPGAKNLEKALQKIISEKKMPTSIYIGKDAHFVHYFRRILPEKFYHYLMFKSFKKMLSL
jgi:short-subunit dehydrogenase